MILHLLQTCSFKIAINILLLLLETRSVFVHHQLLLRFSVLFNLGRLLLSFLQILVLIIFLFSVESKILRIENRLDYTGAFAPMTGHGRIIVDGILTSCYAATDYANLAHFVHTPLRLWYYLQNNVLAVSQAQTQGIHLYSKALIQVANILDYLGLFTVINVS